jgi:predicted acyltransferase
LDDQHPENNRLAKSPMHGHLFSRCPKEFSMTAGHSTTAFALTNPLGVLTRMCLISLLAAPTALMLMAMSRIVQNQGLRDRR